MFFKFGINVNKILVFSVVTAFTAFYYCLSEFSGLLKCITVGFRVFVISYGKSMVTEIFFDVSQYREFVDSCDFVTYEFEHIDRNILEYASQNGKLRPFIKAVELKQDRSLEKNISVTMDFQ